jgi:hypothetical protein
MGRCDELRWTLLPKITVSTVLGLSDIVVFSLLLGCINKTLGGSGFLPLFLASFVFSTLRVVCHELFLILINQKRNGEW